MTNEEENRNNGNDGSGPNTNSDIFGTISTASGILSNHQHPNGSIGLIDENNSGAEGNASDDCGDKMAKESDPLQPKMLKSRSSHKVKEVIGSYFHYSHVFKINCSNSSYIIAINGCIDNTRSRTRNMEPKSRIFVGCHWICS